MTPDRQILTPVARQCRNATVALIAGLWPGRSIGEIESRLIALPLRQQGWVVTSVLGMMGLISLFAAQFGILGLALFYFAAVALIA